MPKLYCRVNPRTEIEKRDRAGQRFTRNWHELDGIDDATLAALQEDPYLEVSDTPTVLVEVAAVIETEQDLNNIPESEATDEGSTGAIAAEGSDTGTAAPVANEESNEESNDEQNAPAGDAVNGADVDTATADSSTAQDSAELSSADVSANEGGSAQPEAEKEAPVLDQRSVAIAGAIGLLDPNNSGHWLKDGRPNLDAVTALTGFNVLAAERDAVWAGLNKGAD